MSSRYGFFVFLDIAQLIEDKKKKEEERVVHNWEDEGVRVEKARWGKVIFIT